MTTVPKQIKAALALARSQPEEIVSQGYAVVTSLTGNPNFTNLPVDLNVLKAGLDTYFALIAEARDGSRKAITARNKQGENVIRMLRQLAAYVEIQCKDDMNIFLSSGFKPRPNARTSAQPLDQPIILSVDQGVTGQLLAWIKAVFKAKHYQLRCGPVGPGGATPVSWLMLTVSGTKAAAPFNGLTPGTMYAIQVRAYGKLGYTDWSDSATRMCI